MAKQIRDVLTRKYEAKECFFDGDTLMVSVKDSDPIEINLMKDLKDFFKDNEFNISVQMKSESEVNENKSSDDYDEESYEEM